MNFLRTPDSCFQDLPDFDFSPNYEFVDDQEGGQLRVHYLDEGPKTAAPVLLMHGEPSWSYLYRHMIPPLSDNGHRVLAPDLIGFGRSDKPAEQSDHSYQRQVDWMADWVRKLDLRGVTLFCQDWGGLIGLRLVALMPDRFARVVVSNTGLPTGDHPTSPAFERWLDHSQNIIEFNAGRVVNDGTMSKISGAEMAAYNAPFPDARYQAAARCLPRLVPITRDDPASAPNRAAWAVLSRLKIPFLTLFGDSDPVTAGVQEIFHLLVPGTRGQDHAILPRAGHFIQEDASPELARRIHAFIQKTR